MIFSNCHGAFQLPFVGELNTLYQLLPLSDLLLLWLLWAADYATTRFCTWHRSGWLFSSPSHLSLSIHETLVFHLNSTHPKWK